LRASLPVHSFCSSAFAFATQHPALESDLTIPPISLLVLHKQRSRLSLNSCTVTSIGAKPAIITKDGRVFFLFFYGSVNLPYLRHITFLRAKQPRYHLRRRAGFSCACNANC